MALAQNDAQEDRLWSQLIGFIRDGALVPVIGPELLEIASAKGGLKNLYEFLRGSARAAGGSTAASTRLPSSVAAGKCATPPQAGTNARKASWEIQVFRGGEAESVSLPLDN